jgi:hypothetical protein
VESAITRAKRELINDHIEHCLGSTGGEGTPTRGLSCGSLKP